jgi:hypothetical protein
MKSLSLALILTCCIAGSLIAQDALDIRAPDIDTASPDGALLAQAGISEDAGERQTIYEKFIAEFSESEYIGYVYLQLQGMAVTAQDHAKMVEYGEKLLEIVPNDLEVRHNINQGLLGQQKWEELYPRLVEARPLAETESVKPKPEDADDEALWQGQVDYAKGVAQWLEWATNTAGVSQTDPAQQIVWMDRLRNDYPDSQYAKGLETKYVAAYQGVGDQAKMVEAMKAAVDGGFQDEGYLYTLGEDAVNKQDIDGALMYANQTISLLETKAKPEGMADEDWEAHKAKFSAYSNYVIGKAEVTRNTRQAFRDGRTALLTTVDLLKAEGGQRYHVLAYYLGICYVQLDIKGDNKRQALQWMGEAAKTEGPFQQQAAETIKKINSL